MDRRNSILYRMVLLPRKYWKSIHNYYRYNDVKRHSMFISVWDGGSPGVYKYDGTWYSSSCYSSIGIEPSQLPWNRPKKRKKK